MLTLTNETLVNLIHVFWVVVILGVLFLYYAYRRSKIDNLATHIELEKVTLDEKYSQMDDADLLKFSNDDNRLRPDSPTYVPPKKPSS